jgi:hypothetical protein
MAQSGHRYMPPTRKPGRPPLDDGDETVSVSFRLPSAQYDELARRAQQERLSLSEQLRRELAARQLRTQK